MPRVTIDGQSVSVPDGATIIDAARAAGIVIPTLCHREHLPAQTSCMVCVVSIEGAARLAPSCATKVREGMVIESQSDEVVKARRMALELLLSDHLGDCLGPCQLGCPAGIDIPRMTRQIVAGDLAGAIATVKARIPLPAVLGRVCPAPCENTCRRGEHDEPVAICLLKRWVGDEDLDAQSPWRPEIAPATGKRVAVIGAGPAGLSAAYYLRLAGHDVTILDEHELPGGGLAEADGLPAHVLNAEAATVLEGIDLQTGVRVGRDADFAGISASFAAVLLAIGEVEKPTADELGIPFGSRGLEADRRTHQSPLDGVFVAGAALRPSKLAVQAVRSGREAALAIDQYLAGEEVLPAGHPFNVTLGRIDQSEAARMAEFASDRLRTTPSRGEYLGFNDEEAVREALRCMHCDCRALHDCRLRAAAVDYEASPRAYPTTRRRFQRDATHPAIVFEPGKCIDCGLCVATARQHEEEIGITFVGRGFDLRTSVPFGATLAEGLQRAALECAEVCPTGAIVARDDAEAGGDDGDE